MSPTADHADRRADALHTFATAVGELRLLLEPAAVSRQLLPDSAPADLTRALDAALAAATAAGYSRAVALGMLTHVLRPTVLTDEGRLEAAHAQLALLRQRTTATTGAPAAPPAAARPNAAEP